MKNPNVSDLPGPDLGDLVGTAADVVSSTAALVPGIDDYRAAARCRRWLSSIGALALVAIVVVVVQRRRTPDDTFAR